MVKLLQNVRCAVLAAVVCVATVLPSFGANLVDLAISLSGDTVNVTAPAGALDTTSKLYLAYDSSDRGDDLSAWPVANRILYTGTVTSAAATYQFDGSGIPAGMIVRAFATSDTRLINSYVKLQGNQYIDTGVADSSAYGVDFKFRPLSASTGGNYASVIAAESISSRSGCTTPTSTTIFAMAGAMLLRKAMRTIRHLCLPTKPCRT